MRSRLFRLALCALATALPLSASAQFDAPTLDPFTLSVSPEFPQPGGTATVSAVSTALDLANASMVVTAGGKELYRGAVRAVPVPLGGAGVTTIVKVSITSAGTTSAASVSITPEDVILIAEPLSSAPPLYPGKPLVPTEGQVRFVAVANFRTAGGKSIDPGALSYAWSIDDTRVPSASGIGQAAFLAAVPLQYRDRTVSVRITSQDGTLAGGASSSITPQLPVVRLYENDPLLGVRFDHALTGTYSIAGPEASLYGALFSFPTTNGTPSLSWYLNGSSVQQGPVVTLRPTGAGAGTASLSFLAALSDVVRSTAALSVSFGGSASTNLFGL